MYKFYSTRPYPRGAIFMPSSSIPYIDSLRDDWAKLVSTTNIVRAYYAYRITHSHILLPDALMTVRNALVRANMGAYDNDLLVAGLSWQEINALLF